MSSSTPTKYRDHIVWRNEHNQIHRLDGPAIEYLNGHKEWCLNGIHLREEEFITLRLKQIARLIKIVFMYHLKLSVVYLKGLLKDLLAY